MNHSIKADTPGYIVEMTAKNLKRAFQQLLTNLRADVTVDQWVVLDVVQKHVGISQQEIAIKTGKDKPTITRILDRLEEKQLLGRKMVSTDRRKFGIYPSQQGTTLVRDLMPHVQHFRMTHFEGLSDVEVQTLLHILGKINDNINAAKASDYALL